MKRRTHHHWLPREGVASIHTSFDFPLNFIGDYDGNKRIRCSEHNDYNENINQSNHWFGYIDNRFMKKSLSPSIYLVNYDDIYGVCDVNRDNNNYNIVRHKNIHANYSEIARSSVSLTPTMASLSLALSEYSGDSTPSMRPYVNDYDNSINNCASENKVSIIRITNLNGRLLKLQIDPSNDVIPMRCWKLKERLEEVTGVDSSSYTLMHGSGRNGSSRLHESDLIDVGTKLYMVEAI